MKGWTSENTAHLMNKSAIEFRKSFEPVVKASKYKAQKCEYNGIKFDSKKEMKRYQDLELMLHSGEISDLQLQVPFVLYPLIPKMFRAISYVADFVYKDASGSVIVEDSKGFRTRDYKIKKRLMYEVHKILIKET